MIIVCFFVWVILIILFVLLIVCYLMILGRFEFGIGNIKVFDLVVKI